MTAAFNLSAKLFFPVLESASRFPPQFRQIEPAAAAGSLDKSHILQYKEYKYIYIHCKAGILYRYSAEDPEFLETTLSLELKVTFCGRFAPPLSALFQVLCRVGGKNLNLGKVVLSLPSYLVC